MEIVLFRKHIRMNNPEKKNLELPPGKGKQGSNGSELDYESYVRGAPYVMY